MPPKDRKLEQLARIAEGNDNLIVYAANLVSWSKGEIEDFEKRKILLSIGYSDEVTCNKCHKQPCTVNPKIVDYPDGQKKGVCYCTDPEQGGRLEFELDELKYWEINKTKLKELENREKPRSNIGGMSWQEVQIKAEALVNEKGYLGFGKLKEAVGCSEGTLRKVITEKSSKLQQAKEEYESISKTLKAVGLTAKVIATYETSSGPKLSDTEVDEILVEMLERIKQERPEMLEQTKEQLEKMNIDQKREFAKVYQRDYRNKKSSLKKAGPKTQHQYKKV